MDLVIRNARLTDAAPDAPLTDIGITRGRITAIDAHLPGKGATEFDAAGRLTCPGLIESHIHLDKSRIIDRCAPQERRTLSPVNGVTPIKDSMTVEDNRQRAERTLQIGRAHV